MPERVLTEGPAGPLDGLHPLYYLHLRVYDPLPDGSLLSGPRGDILFTYFPQGHELLFQSEKVLEGVYLLLDPQV